MTVNEARCTPPFAGDGVPAHRGWRAYRWLLLLASLVVVVDQATKFLIMATLPQGTYHFGHQPEPVAIIPGFFYLVHVVNEGAAWSLFDGYARWLGVLGLIALVAIYGYRRQLGLHLLSLQIIFGLIIGGILGNMIDRFAYGHVVDFIDWHFGSYRYPSFNLADSAIVVGVIAYFIYGFCSPETPAKPSSPQDNAR
jgi:signal peptidase II